MRDVCFGIPSKYDSGKNSSVGINSNGVVVEVHESQSILKLGMWFSVGWVNGLDVSWTRSREYDTGVRPAVAINDHGIVVEVHRWGPSNEKLVSLVGQVEKDTIEFGSAAVYDTGDTPGIALNNAGQVVEVHQSALNDTDLFYRTGVVSGRSIIWNQPNFLGKGNHPRVSLNNQGDAVVVFSAATGKEICYACGQLEDSGHYISWGSPERYDFGSFPGVAIADDGFVTLVHQHGEEGDRVNRRVGTLRRNAHKIDFLSSPQFAESITCNMGSQPSLGCSSDGRMAIQTNRTESYDLRFATSLIIDRKEWMGSIYENIRSKGLWQISMAGSHDAGAYDMSIERVPPQYRDMKFDIPGLVGIFTRTMAETHVRDIAGQLEGGSRQFDPRPIYWNGRFHAYHDVYGANFSDMLDQFAAFLSETQHELVILNIFAFADFDAQRHQTFLGMINDKLGDRIIAPQGDKPLTMPFEKLVGQGLRAIVVYDNEEAIKAYKKTSHTNILPRFASSVGGWTQTFSCYEDLAADCKDKLANNKASETASYVLPWQIAATQDAGGYLRVAESGFMLRRMASEANKNLARFLAQNAGGHQINLCWSDFLEDARTTDCMIVRNL